MYRETVEKINRPPRRGKCAAYALLFALTGLAAQETTARLLPGQRPGRSLSAWDARGALLRPSPVGGEEYAVEGAAYAPDANTDLLMHFDRSGELNASGAYSPARGASYETGPGKIGPGAALFRSGSGGIALDPGPGALFAPGSEPGSFSVEFWLSPAKTEDGDSVLSWMAGRWLGKKQEIQSLKAAFAKGRLNLSLANIFTSRKGAGIRIDLEGKTILVPGTWSHHLLRFDFDTGLVEYLMNGRPEASAYATESGREGSAVCEPSIGGRSGIALGPSYRGLMDEFRVTRAFVESPVLRAYNGRGATVFSPILDLGSSGSSVIGIEIGARASGTQGIERFFRAAEDYAGWSDDSPAWIPFEPGKPLPGGGKGRYVQVIVKLYPDGTGESSPSLRSIVVDYRPDPPPPPPARFSLIPGDGEILVSWTRVPEADIVGYRVYYGEGPRTYGSADGAEGKSPVDAGDASSLRLTGLVNGKLYYVAVTAYEADGPEGLIEEGEFSAEAAARPLRKAK
jgi:hypothetical protein